LSKQVTTSDVNKATSVKAKAKAKTTTPKAKAKATTLKAVAKTKATISKAKATSHSHMLPQQCHCQTTHSGWINIYEALKYSQAL